MENLMLKLITAVFLTVFISTAGATMLPSSTVIESSNVFSRVKSANGFTRKHLKVNKNTPNVFQIPFTNPYTEQEVVVQNGCVVLYASADMVGKLIRDASAANTTPNPLGITHTGFVIIENPRVLYNMILDMQESRDPKILLDSNTLLPPLNPEQQKHMLQELEDHCRAILDMSEDPGIFLPFSLESNGSAGEVLKGYKPGVHLYYFPDRIRDYAGNVFIRPLNLDVQITQADTRLFILEELGRLYTSFLQPKELILSPQHLNTPHDAERVFCSEEVAYFFQRFGFISEDIVAANVIPEDLSSAAGDADVIKSLMQKEITLKITTKINPLEQESICMSCMCGCISCCYDEARTVKAAQKALTPATKAKLNLFSSCSEAE